MDHQMMHRSPGPDRTCRDERRRHVRYTADFRVLLVRRGLQKLQMHGRGIELSEEGLSVFLPSDFSVGEGVEMEVKLSYMERPLRLRAVVRNRHNYRYGLEFCNLVRADREAIARTCTALSLLE